MNVILQFSACWIVEHGMDISTDYMLYQLNVDMPDEDSNHAQNGVTFTVFFMLYF